MMTLKDIQQLLTSPKKIVLVTHARPDGDAIGSLLAMYHYLRQQHHDITPITPDVYPSYLGFLPASEQILIGEEAPEQAQEVFEAADLIFILDFNSPKRIDQLEGLLLQAKGVKVMIDHHLEPDDFVDFQFCDPHASSAAELVYEFIEALQHTKLINREIATCLYAGICTDTGRFKYNIRGRLHQIVAVLIQKGADANAINESIFNSLSEDRLRFIGFCISERLTILQDLNAAVMYITLDDFVRFNYQPGDTEGLVNYPLSLKGIRFVALLKEADDKVKISFRSKGSFSVNSFARKHCNGGGHLNASGGALYNYSITEAQEHIINLLEDYRAELVEVEAV